MAENSLPTPPVDRPVERLEYVPISGLAVGSLLCSGFFFIALIIMSILSLIGRKPLIVTELLILAVIGLILSILARLSIQRSEGTKTGLRLATIAWWLSVLGGAGYAAYYFANEQVLRSQAERHIKKALDYLAEGKMEYALLQCIEPTVRAGVNPEDQGEMDAKFGGKELPSFRSSELVRIFERNKNQVQYASMGLKNWEYKENKFEVVAVFQIRSPEGIYTQDFVVFGTSTKETRDRQWHMFFNDNGLRGVNRTAYSRSMRAVMEDVSPRLATWYEEQRSPTRVASYAMFYPPDKRKQNNGRLLAAGLLGGSALSKLAPVSFKPSQFVSTLCVQENGSPLPADKLSAAEKVVDNGGIYPGGVLRGIREGLIPHLVIEENRLQVLYPVDLQLVNGVGKGEMVIQVDHPETIKKIWELRQHAAKDPSERDTVKGRLFDPISMDDWYIKEIRSNFEGAPVQSPIRE